MPTCWHDVPPVVGERSVPLVITGKGGDGMDDAHRRAQETRKANQAAVFEAQRKAAEQLAESVRGLNVILTDPEASREERLEAARLIVELKNS